MSSILNSYRVGGANATSFEISKDQWNAFITAIEGAEPLATYTESGTNSVTLPISFTKWNALLGAIGPGFLAAPYLVGGVNDPSKPISKDVWNALMMKLQSALERFTAYQGPVCNNLRMPDWIVGNGGVVPRIRSRSSHYSTEALSQITIGLAPFICNANNGDLNERIVAGATPLKNSKQTLSIEYPLGTIHAVAKLAGLSTFTIVPGPTVQLDALTVDIPSGAQFWVNRSAENADASVPAVMPLTFYGGEGGFAVHGNAMDNDFSGGVVDPTVLYPCIDNYNVFSAPPAYILGATTKRTFALIGNSRTEGVQDTLASNTYGDIGQMARALTEQGIAYINMGYGSDSVTDWLASHTYRLPVAQLCTDVIVGDPTNDFGGKGLSAAATITAYHSLATFFTGERVYAITSPPIATTSTDGYVTTTNQTVDTSFNNKLITFNTAVRAGLTGYTGYFEAGDVLATSRDSGIWALISGLPGTADGVHELPRANQAIADSGAFNIALPALRLGTLSGTFTLPENAVQGAAAGTVAGKTSGSALSLLNNAGGRVALSGTTISRGTLELNYETATSHSFTVREVHADAANGPRDTVLTLGVTDIIIGPEMVTNGEFATDTAWTKGANTVISAGKATATAQAAFTNFLAQVLGSLSTAKIYRIVFTISDYTAGSVFIRFGNNGNNVLGPYTANGTYSADFQPANVATQDISFHTTTAATLSIDDVSVKNVDT